MGKKQSLRSKATQIVSVILNPISNSDTLKHSPPPPSDEVGGFGGTTSGSEKTEEGSNDLVDGPDTSSFSAFLYSLLSSSDAGGDNAKGRKDNNSEMNSDCLNGSGLNGVEMNHLATVKGKESESVSLVEPSMLLSEAMRSTLYVSLPALVHGRKWLLLYREQSTFVFTNISGHPVIYRPTGLNRYFTLCNSEFLAIGGGSHFALYLDGDLLNGSSSVSETYGNPCLANSQDFEVKEVEFQETFIAEELTGLSLIYTVMGLCVCFKI
ncbi:TLD domain-containing protein [Arachis hypogaea]|nr:TLD domain-containing protein [Arachis hypogaea]